MARFLVFTAAVGGLALALLGSVTLSQTKGVTPKFEVDPWWPKPLPEGWITGRLGAVCVDSHDHVIVTNGALLGGHVMVQDRAFLSGNCLVHQFVRVGTLALMQGGAAISKDLPPFCVARGDNGICGLNAVGLRRAGFKVGERLELKRLYHVLFRSAQK